MGRCGVKQCAEVFDWVRAVEGGTNEASQNGAFVVSVHEGALPDTLRFNVKWPQFGPAWMVPNGKPKSQ
jgi:hypothetical protein